MSFRSHQPLKLQPISPPSLSALAIGATKKKVDGTLAVTRLGNPVTDKWLNERFRQCMLLVLQFRLEWPNQSLLTANDLDYIRTCLDTALASCVHEAHVGDIYDLSPTVWSIFLVQHVKAVRNGGWKAESEHVQKLLSFENLYNWLEVQSERGEAFNVRDSSTGLLLNRYRLPFKQMNIPPKSTELFRFRKCGKRLSDWMVQGGLSPIDQGIQTLFPPQLVAAPPLQSDRLAFLDRRWARVAAKARIRRLDSIGHDSEESELTRTVVGAVMDARRSESPQMTDTEADDFAHELEEAMVEQELQQQPRPSQSASTSNLSAYELQRLENIAKNKQMLIELGLESSVTPTRAKTTVTKDTYPPGRSGALPTRSSTREKKDGKRSYVETESDDEEDV